MAYLLLVRCECLPSVPYWFLWRFSRPVPGRQRVLIGTWDVPGSNATTRITYNPDHTWTIWQNDQHGITTDTAEWRLEGDEIVALYKGKEIGRIRIVSLTSNQLRIEDRNIGILTWSRLK